MIIELPKLHSSQRIIKNNEARFKVLACGRRWGKTRLASALMTAAALEGGVCWLISPTYSTGTPCFDDLRRLAQQIPGSEIIRGDRLIRYPGAGLCQVKSGEDPALLRGVSLDLAVFDEAAFLARLQEVWLEVIRPALADRKGKALFCSTPNGKNFFHQLYQWGQNPLQTEWASWQLGTLTNPYIAPSEVESARKQMTERQFDQEFGAQFRDDAGVFSNVRQLATAELQKHGQLEHVYVAGVDWGRVNDATVFSVIDATLGHQCYQERLVGMPYEQQIERLKSLNERFNLVVILAEANSMGQPLIERLQRGGLPVKGFQTTNQSKALIIDRLVMGFEQESIHILPDATLIGELQSYEVETLPSGLVRYSAPTGLHDDCVMALALSWQAAKRNRTKRVAESWQY